MSKTDWIQRFERAAISRNPVLATKLQPGLSEGSVERVLSRKKATGELAPIIALYTWKNGTDLTSDPAVLSFNEFRVSRSFFPGKPYFFPCFELTAGHFETLKDIAKNYPKVSEAVGRYFPFFWDGATEHLAIDLKPGNGNRVLIVDHSSEQPILEAYGSFEEFVTDAIRANTENKPLRCFQNWRPGISEREKIEAAIRAAYEKGDF